MALRGAAPGVPLDLLAGKPAQLAGLSREVPSVREFEFATSLAARVQWTPDLAKERFLTERALAWAHAARGAHRTAQRMMHACGDAAPSPQWRATIYGELAHMVRMVGAGEAADALLENATEYARAISWDCAGEERVGLLSLIELIRKLMERQAIRRLEEKTLTPDEIENVGQALMKLEHTVHQIAKRFKLDPGDLNLDLGPIGRLH